MSYLELLAKAILDGRVSIEPQYPPHSEQPWSYQVIVDPDPEQAAIDSIKKGKV